MTARKTRHLKMWVAMVLASAVMILGHGFYRDLSANNEETYKGLKLFSDVIELVQKNYVDEIDTQNMIEAAIQGMVRSLDPHSSLLPPDALTRCLEPALRSSSAALRRAARPTVAARQPG